MESTSNEIDKLNKVMKQKEAADNNAKEMNERKIQYEPKLFSCDAKYYDGYRDALFHSEQAIIRIIDAYMNKIKDIKQLSDIHKAPIEGKIKFFILNLHTRFDMCPYCLMYLANSFQKWKKQLENISFLVIVGSKQEYRCQYPVITNKEYYIGYSMRSIGRYRIRQRENEQAQLDENIANLKEVANKGLVIQYALPAHLIYRSLKILILISNMCFIHD